MKTFLGALTCGVLMLALPGAHARSFCASDGQPQPVQFMERFINADCDGCWTDPATPRVRAGQAVLDWVVPGDKGDAAPLSVVARLEGLDRLQALGQQVPRGASTRTRAVKRIKGVSLRVAHGLALSAYVGVSMELKPVPSIAKKQRWTAWLALVETLPKGTEGAPVARNLVRNLLQANWDGHKQLSIKEQNRFFESRVMSVAEGVNPDRLRVIGWVEDATGQILIAAESRCKPAATRP